MIPDADFALPERDVDPGRVDESLPSIRPRVGLSRTLTILPARPHRTSGVVTRSLLGRVSPLPYLS
eukprot:7598967-Pyramimonas_sp.AAC.1